MPNPPKPTALKLLDGSAAHNPGRVNRQEPHPAEGGAAPRWLPTTGRARSAWNRLYPVVSAMRVMTVADAEALAIGCQTFAEYAATPVEHWKKRDALRRAYLGVLRDFGMTPASRTRVKVTAPGDVDPVAEWAAR